MEKYFAYEVIIGRGYLYFISEIYKSFIVISEDLASMKIIFDKLGLINKSMSKKYPIYKLDMSK
jgi:hypothetical protein